MPKDHAITIGKRAVVCQDIELKGEIQIGPALTIGDDNVFEVGCYVEGSKIGSKNIIEAKGNNCVVGAVCSTKKDEIILDNTVIYGDHHNRRIQTASANQISSLHTRHLDYLREVLPKFNHIRVVGAPESQEIVPISRKAIKQTASH
ncbi:9773_t:CDS:2 [Funneliformis mosseae]|uniref:Dynactin subunit 6 n=1 Tax=Funneliformis mosseae TaxID=27381 RepID=A0A9N8ZZ64_FUNMO|nr:9773_t:CDS:2 [Funneliformis mosseae]